MVFILDHFCFLHSIYDFFWASYMGEMKFAIWIQTKIQDINFFPVFHPVICEPFQWAIVFSSSQA